MKYCVTINDKRYEVEVERENAAIVSATKIALEVVKNNNFADVQSAATTITPKIIEVSEQTNEVSSGIWKEVIKAPMAGEIIDIKVSVGSAVKEGDTLLLLEAMKMENEIIAHFDGVITEIKYAKGTYVSSDDVLVVIK
jgi:glutaconyl-CoA/methylmalonyl-CoA decarboxylase subunit gamma